jgi:hypothetical protein
VPNKKHSAKDGFANTFFTEWNLSSVTLGKGFAECNCGFAECPWHLAKRANPVVYLAIKKIKTKNTSSTTSPFKSPFSKFFSQSFKILSQSIE